MPIFLKVKFVTDKDTTAVLRYSDEWHGFEIVRMTPGKILQEYHKRASARPQPEPLWRLHKNTYENVAKMIRQLYMDTGDSLDPIFRNKAGLILQYLTVRVEPVDYRGLPHSSGNLVGSKIYFEDEHLQPYVWYDQIKEVEVIYQQ